MIKKYSFCVVTLCLNLEYRQNGAVVVRNAIPQALIHSVVETIGDVYRSEGFSGSLEEIICRLNVENQPLLYQLHLKTSLREIFKPVEACLEGLFRELLNTSYHELVGNSSGYLLGLPQDKRLVYDFHQECHYMKRVNPILTAHFPLNVACTSANGAMSYLNGSSALGALPYQKSRITNGYTNLLPIDIEKIVEDYEEIQPELNLGDCLFFDEFCIHKSNYNASDLPRLCGIFRVTTDKSARNLESLSPDDL